MAEKALDFGNDHNHGLTDEDFSLINRFSSKITSYSSNTPLGQHLGNTTILLTTSKGHKNIEKILNEYQPNIEISDEQAFKPCEHQGCDIIKPVLYSAKEDVDEEDRKHRPAFGIYVFNKDLYVVSYNIQIAPTNDFFLGIKRKIEQKLSSLKPEIVNQLLGFEAINDANRISSDVSRFYKICRDGVKNDITLCGKHLHLANTLKKEFAWRIGGMMRNMGFDLVSSSDYEIEKVVTSQEVKYDTLLINAGKAPEFYNVNNNQLVWSRINL